MMPTLIDAKRVKRRRESKIPSVNTLEKKYKIIHDWLEYWNKDGHHPKKRTQTKGYMVFSTIADKVFPTYSAMPFFRQKEVLSRNAYKDLKPIRFVRNPYHVPILGGKNGELTKYLRSIPVRSGNCYPTALAIASRFPEVNLVWGMYESNRSVRQKIDQKWPDDLRHHLQLMLDRKRWEDRLNIRDVKKEKNGWIEVDEGAEGNFFYHRDKKGHLWIFHAWNEFQGIHFDPWLNIVFKNRMNEADWFSKSHGMIPWMRYKALEISNIDDYSPKSSDSEKKQIRQWIEHHSLFSSLGMLCDSMPVVIDSAKWGRDTNWLARTPINMKWMVERKMVP
jgi:hypothetical protein